MMKKEYSPKPIDTTDVELSTDMLELCEKVAENVHEVWASGRIKEGWSFGDQRSDLEKKHPCLVPYDELPESEKEYDRNTVIETIKTINKLGLKSNTVITDVEWKEGEGKIEKIVECINGEDHNIVPIIGMEVFYVENEPDKTLQKYIVREIIQRYISAEMKDKVYNYCKEGDSKAMTKLYVALEKFGNIDYKEGGYDQNSLDIYDCIYTVTNKIKNRIALNPLVKDFLLFGKFPLIITTCYVNILSNLILGPNGKSYEPIDYFGYGNKGGDLHDSGSLNKPTIFNLFGVIKNSSPAPMIIEDDFLRYLHCLHDTGHQPVNLKTYLENKQLFIIGCNIPDWTFRFMLHSLIEKDGEIPKEQGGRGVSFRGGALKPIIDYDLAGFLSEIKYIYGNNVSKILERINSKIKRRQVFISYSAQPGTPIWTWIETFRKKLEPSSIVWFFPEQSKGTYGERYWDLIQQGVEKCDLFIPIVTKHMLDVLENENIGEDGPIEDVNSGFLCEWARFLKARRYDEHVRCIPYMMEVDFNDIKNLIKQTDKKLSFLWPLFKGAQHINGDPAYFDPDNLDEFGGTLLNN